MDDSPGEAVDLYEDLLVEGGEGDGHFRAETEELRSQLSAKTAETLQLQQELETAQAENTRLVKEREVLVRNISCLFKTAQLEIQRKDNELRQLRERVAVHTG